MSSLDYAKRMETQLTNALWEDQVNKKNFSCHNLAK